MIRWLADVSTLRDGDAEKVQLIIDVHEADPPVGTVARGAVEGDHHVMSTIEFVGWLGMLRALSELLTDTISRDELGGP